MDNVKFSELTYTRPADVGAKLDVFLADMRAAANYPAFLSAYRQLDDYIKHFITMASLAQSRYCMDTRDPFYTKEQDYFDEVSPVVEEKVAASVEIILASPYEKEIEGELSEAIFSIQRLKAKAASPEITALRAQDNALSSRYQQLIGGGLAHWQGEDIPLPLLHKHKESENAETRRAAFAAEGAFYKENAPDLDDIYSQMVALRTQMAQKLGFPTYVEMAYCEQGRNCYGQEEVAALRAGVRKHIVPLLQKLLPALSRLAGTKEYTFSDWLHTFATGNPVPYGTPDEIFRAGGEMYKALSPETDEFYNFMIEGELFDVLSRPGKMGGGFATYLFDFARPFIFANFNGTPGDINVLTHECGHAFEMYRQGKQIQYYSQIDNTSDVMEIHSMSMEFFTYPYMHLFFKDTEKYYLTHLLEALKFLPYGCMVDEFQHIAYQNPQLTPEERNGQWLKLEGTYRGVSLKGLPRYEEGGGWQMKQHIYTSPFYYIDYVFAQLVALQFYFAAKKDPKDAWARYLALVDASHENNFRQLVKKAGLKDPCQEETLAEIARELEEDLAGRLAAWENN